MFEECKSITSWVDCIDCKLLETPICPLKGSDIVEKIANRIKMKENPQYNGFKKEISPLNYN